MYLLYCHVFELGNYLQTLKTYFPLGIVQVKTNKQTNKQTEQNRTKKYKNKETNKHKTFALVQDPL